MVCRLCKQDSQQENRDVVDMLHKRSLLLRRLQLSISQKSKECKCYSMMLQRL